MSVQTFKICLKVSSVMQQWTSAQWDVSLTQLLGLKHLSPGVQTPAPGP